MEIYVKVILINWPNATDVSEAVYGNQPVFMQSL